MMGGSLRGGPQSLTRPSEKAVRLMPLRIPQDTFPNKTRGEDWAFPPLGSKPSSLRLGI